MRPIDADDFMERMECDTDLCAEMEQDGLKALKKYLDLQPTAYDVDKIVEQLEEERNLHMLILTDMLKKSILVLILNVMIFFMQV